MGDKLQKYYRSIPKIFKPETNPVINALIQGFAEADEEICTQLANCKAQLFVKTASGQYLTRLAASQGVERPQNLGISDEMYRNLVPNLSLKSRQIRKTFYDTMDVFWGVLYSRANVTSLNYAPFNVSTNDKISISINGATAQVIKVLAGDLVSSGAATAAEMITILSRLKKGTPSIITDEITGKEYINIRTDAVGMVGSVEVVTSSMLGSSKFDLPVGKYELWQQSLRTVIYEINPNEITIEIPAAINILDDSLLNSHHIHADATIESPVAPNNGVWQGSFINNPSTGYNNKTVSSQKAKIQQLIKKGEVRTYVNVDATTSFEETTGELIFDFGMSTEEYPVKYRGIQAGNVVLLDPSYVFQYVHQIDSTINVLTTGTGTEYNIYIPSVIDARTIIQTILESLAAAGVIVNFVIMTEDYKYIIENPYL